MELCIFFNEQNSKQKLIMYRVSQKSPTKKKIVYLHCILTKWAEFFPDDRDNFQVFIHVSAAYQHILNLASSTSIRNLAFLPSPSVVNHKNQKGIRKLIEISCSVELFLLIILIKKTLYFHQEIMLLESKYWKTWNSAGRNNEKFFNILTLVPLFLDENRKTFLPKWSA